MNEPTEGLVFRDWRMHAGVAQANTELDRLRAMIREEIHNALYPGGTISAHEHRRVEMSDQDGKRWRGVLYRVDGHATDPMLPVAKEE